MNIFYQSIERGAYRYNSDTFALYGFIKKSDREISGSIADIGSGSGILGILIAKDNPKIELDSFEVQLQLCKLTKKNAQINNIKISCYSGDFLETDKTNKYDYIISNPPFYSSATTQSNWEILQKSRYNDNLPIDLFFKKVFKSLKDRGRFIFCYRADLAQIVFSQLENNNLRAERVRFLYPSENKPASLIMIEARKNSKSSTIIELPLYSKSDEMMEVYRLVPSHSILADISDLDE